MKIGIIGGGNMAEAIIAGLILTKTNTYEIIVSEPSTERQKVLKEKFKEVVLTSHNLEVIKKTEVVILAVKPQIFPELLKEIAEHTERRTLISIAAGIPMKLIQIACPKAKIVRIMPNTPFLAMAGCGGISFDTNFNQESKNKIISIFNNSGKLLEVPEEKLHAVTAISGSGPAYFFYFTEELIKAGIHAGLNHEEANFLATHTLYGAGKLLLESQDSAETLRKKVTSPNGTTEAAINCFLSQNTNIIIQNAVTAAMNRSKELAGEE